MVRKPRAGLVDAAAANDREAALRALIVRLAKEIESADAQTLPNLSRQFRQALAELEGMPKQERSAIDEIAKRRARRIAKTKSL
jgi:DNA-binding GntR family transcriptional regulator